MPAWFLRRSPGRLLQGLCLGLLAAALVGCAGQTGDPVRPGVSGSCSVAFKVSAQASPFAMVEVDRTVRMCGSYADWKLGLRERPGLLGGQDPVDYLVGRCTDATTDLGGFAVCRTLALALVTPPPTPAPTATPPRIEIAVTTPKPGKHPSGKPDTGQDGNGRKVPECGTTRTGIQKGSTPCPASR